MMEVARKQAAKAGRGETLEDLYRTKYAFLKQGQVRLLWEDVIVHEKDSIPAFTSWRNKVSVDLVPSGAKRVLDIGVGMGHAVRYLAERLPDVEIFGTDISQRAVQRASELFQGHFAVADLGELPWRGPAFDTVLMLEVLEHVEAPRTFEVLRWVHSILAESGTLILSVPLETVPSLRQSYSICPHCGQPVHQIGHVRSYSEYQPIRMELTRTGFDVQRMVGLAGGKYLGIPRQWLMRVFPGRVKPMVMIFKCRRRP
jgi:2-polyprenyl-3-methyl-5-hydroxy-6-metoxy-1,4-benzoquinol methylase